MSVRRIEDRGFKSRQLRLLSGSDAQNGKGTGLLSRVLQVQILSGLFNSAG